LGAEEGVLFELVVALAVLLEFVVSSFLVGYSSPCVCEEIKFRTRFAHSLERYLIPQVVKLSSPVSVTLSFHQSPR
jgi:hypothetical protein